jgi:hypothetical protein
MNHKLKAGGFTAPLNNQRVKLVEQFQATKYKDSNSNITNHNMTNLIAHAAHDYDMDIEDVDRIYKLFPDEFYEKLEEFIKERRERAKFLPSKKPNNN